MNSKGPEANELTALLEAHGLAGTPPHIAAALADKIRHLRRENGRPSSPALAPSNLSRADRDRILACSESLLRYAAKPPRNIATIDARRQTLLSFIDGSLSRVIQFAVGPAGVNVVPIARRLQAREETADDLVGLIATVESMPLSKRSGRHPLSVVPLLRAGVAAWEHCGRKERYSFKDEDSSLSGPLPAFLRSLVQLAGTRPINDVNLRQHLRRLQNV